MKVISVKQPWAYLLCAAIKPFENRTWPLPEKYIGETILIHASASDKINFGLLFSYDQLYTVVEKFGSLAEFRKLLHFGAIIGSLKFVDCGTNRDNIWAESNNDYSIGSLLASKTIYNWQASEAILFEKPILDVKGHLSFWDYPMTYEEYLNIGKIGL